VKRFLLEARLQAKLHHPNILNVTNVEDRPEVSLMVMELLKGMSLADYTAAKGGLSEDEALEIMLPIIDAAAAAHALEVVHRDIKPSNIFLAEEDRQLVPKLMDFGVARQLDSSLTSSDTLLGTLPYMSFELIQSARNATPASDVYALAVTIFELISGRHPLPAPTLQEYVYAMMEVDEVDRLASVRPDVSKELDEVLARALRKDASARHESAREFYDALAALPEDRSKAAAPSAASSSASNPRAEPAGRDTPRSRIEAAYNIRHELGRGPVASVFACSGPNDEPLRIKVLDPAFAERDGWRRHFTLLAQQQLAVARETSAVQSVVDVHDAFSAAVSPLDRGSLLSDLLEQYGRLELRYALDLFVQMSEGLAVAHQRGLLHGHIHPANVLATQAPDGRHRGVLMDFGHCLRLARSEIEALGPSLGTVAPELGGNLAQTTTASDIYALGMTLFQALTGQCPSRASTWSQLEREVADVSVWPDIRTIDPALPADLGRVVGWCVSIEPGTRYHDAREVHRDLVAVQHSLGFAQG